MSRVTLAEVRKVMHEHTDEGAEQVATRLEYDDRAVFEAACAQLGPIPAMVFAGAISIGIDIERKRHSVNEDREPVASQDEFLTSLPEADPGYLEST